MTYIKFDLLRARRTIYDIIMSAAIALNTAIQRDRRATCDLFGLRNFFHFSLRHRARILKHNNLSHNCSYRTILYTLYMRPSEPNLYTIHTITALALVLEHTHFCPSHYTLYSHALFYQSRKARPNLHRITR